MDETTLAALAAFPAQIEAHFALFAASRAHWAPADWTGIPSERLTAIEQVCHVRDIEVDGYQHRIARILAEDRPFLDVRVNLYVERPSQKAIIIGKGGARLREVGTTARKAIEALLGARIYLDLHVKVAKDWQRDPKQLVKLGF